MQSGRINKTTIIPVSPYAAARPPTKIGFKQGEGIDVDSAIKALVTRSANDVATAIGEFLGGGSEQQFALMMTEKARAIGMRDTRFQNASGLPDPMQVTTPKDMATLAIMLRRQFPQYYSYFSVTEFSFRGKTIRGHNRLVGGVEGVDGIKTGYIRASGYNVATSVTRGGRRLVVVVMGADSSKQRDRQVAQLIEAYLPSRNGSASLPGPLAVLDPGALPGVAAQ
jgi:D-alanyl-D-alanine carboxypeptidase